jgi:hypothetical protein
VIQKKWVETLAASIYDCDVVTGVVEPPELTLLPELVLPELVLPELVLPELVLPELVLPEPLLPEPLLPEPLLPEPLLPELVLPEPLLPELLLLLAVEPLPEDTDWLPLLAEALATWAVALVFLVVAAVLVAPVVLPAALVDLVPPVAASAVVVDLPSDPTPATAPQAARNSVIVSAAMRRRRTLTRRARARRRRRSSGEFDGRLVRGVCMGPVSGRPLCSACGQPGNRLSAPRGSPLQARSFAPAPDGRPRSRPQGTRPRALRRTR